MLLLSLLACVGGAFGDPCTEYCDYVCACLDGEPGYDCDQCRTENANPDAALQDACETALSELEATDTGCSADTATTW